MSKSVRIALAVVGGLGVAAVVAQRAGLVGGTPGPRTGASAQLPLSCRLKGHVWKSPGNNTQTPTRRTCQKCQRIDLPMP